MQAATQRLSFIFRIKGASDPGAVACSDSGGPLPKLGQATLLQVLLIHTDFTVSEEVLVEVRNNSTSSVFSTVSSAIGIQSDPLMIEASLWGGGMTKTFIHETTED